MGISISLWFLVYLSMEGFQIDSDFDGFSDFDLEIEMYLKQGTLNHQDQKKEQHIY